MQIQESIVATAMEAMPQNIRDRLTGSIDTFYRNELGQSPAHKVCEWPSLDVLSHFKTYKEDEYKAWERECQAAKDRHDAVKRAREEKWQQSQGGFFSGLSHLVQNVASNVGYVISLPAEPTQISDEEALQDINLTQRYLRSVAHPGQGVLNPPPTIGRALLGLEKDSLHNTIVYNYLLDNWTRRGVEEIGSTGNEQIYREVKAHLLYIDSENEPAIHEDIETIIQYLYRINSEYHGNSL